eukprot:m.45099 g.45099  ORF g.45099 m.45099 type:complete len:564 (+) comp15112_c0_seq5:274-1965(+)
MQEAQLRLAREAEGNLSQLQIERDANERAQSEIKTLRLAQANDNTGSAHLEQVQQLQNKIEDLRRQCQDKDSQIHEQAIQIAQKDGQLQHILAQKMSSKSDDDVENDRREIDRLRNLNEQLSQAQINQLAAVQTSPSEFHELERLRNKNELLQDQLSVAQQSIIDASARAVGAEKELSCALDETLKYKQEMDVLKESAAGNNRVPQAEKHQMEINEVREQIEIAKEALDVTFRDLKSKESECEDYFSELQNARATIEKMRTEYDTVNTALQSVRANHDETCAELRGVERLCEERLQEIERLSILNQGRLAEIEKLSKAHQQLLDKLLNATIPGNLSQAQLETRIAQNTEHSVSRTIKKVHQLHSENTNTISKHPDDEGVVESDEIKGSDDQSHRNTTVVNTSFVDAMATCEIDQQLPRIADYEQSEDSAEIEHGVDRADIYTPAILPGGIEKSNRRFSCIVRSTRAARRLSLIGPATLQMNRSGIFLFTGTSAVFEGDEATVFWPMDNIKKYGDEENLFSFEAGSVAGLKHLLVLYWFLRTTVGYVMLVAPLCVVSCVFLPTL